MQTVSSASRTFIALASAVECTATVLIPISRQARWMRSAISPRLAIRTFSNINATDAFSARRGGEGDFELPAYCFQYARQVLHNVPIPEPDHAITALGDFARPRLIRVVPERMLSAIQLNRRLCGRTGKVDNVS